MNQRKLYVPQGFYGAASWGDKKSLRHTLDMARARLLVVCCTFIFIFIIIIGRLVDVSLLRSLGEENIADASALRGKLFRADIMDRNGVLLATSLSTSSLYANARVVLDAKEAADKLTNVLPELNHKETLQRLQNGKGFVWIARHLTPQKQAEIIRLGIPGIYFRQDERRVYPHGELLSHVLGYTDIDNQGLGGIELKFNEHLLSGGGPLQLSLDIRVQHVLRDELLAGIEKFKAQGAAGLVMDARSGEIVAMISLPDFDPNQVGKMGSQREALFNQITLGTYEMGSSFKIFNTALYLESGISKLSNTFDVSGPFRLGRFKITDFHPAHYPLTVAQIFTESSNIGAIKMAIQMGPGRQRAFFEKLGFFTPPALEIPEIGSPLYPKKWGETTMITASYGYGISISPLQLVTAIAGIVNKGIMQPATLLKMQHPLAEKGVRIVSKETSEVMCKLMYMVVAQGTGRKAQVKRYEVGGKTGTANTLKGRSYEKGSNITSFVGAFPMSRPQYVVLVMVDRPQAIKETYGFNAAGWNAAPIAGKVIERIAPLLQVIPTNELQEKLEENPMLIHVSTHQKGEN
ncbi:MAG: penicillin-binding protein 2 [Alphaproteobacteria bacterium]|nr:penicillin-binding protein 2 [Alphaproteobacteria bacterium]